MNHSATTALVVDDDAINRKVLRRHLESAGYDVVSAGDGAEAWRLLEDSDAVFDAVLLDRSMPGLDGLEVLRRMKERPELKSVPVIFQTGMTSPESILEGLRSGAYYYLTKPVRKETLLAIVRTAVADSTEYRELRREVEEATGTLSLMRSGEFRVRTIDEARSLAALLAKACPDARKALVGLSELLINAVEHGNLGITYEEKSELNESGTWREEVERRLRLPEYAEKRVTVSFERSDERVRVTIRDEGDGFDWRAYVDIDPSRLFDSHGRGIAMARLTSFDSLEYRGSGSKVVAELALTETPAGRVVA